MSGSRAPWRGASAPRLPIAWLITVEDGLDQQHFFHRVAELLVKLIVSPELGERVDLDRLTRDLLARMEKDLGTKLDWAAVTHCNTEHPHIHIASRGIRDDNSALDLPRDYVRHGIRTIAKDLCTRKLGHRNQLDAMASERREIQERRFTSLDRASIA